MIAVSFNNSGKRWARVSNPAPKITNCVAPLRTGALHQLVDEARPHQHQPSEAEDVGIVHGFVEILIKSFADGVVGYQNQLSRADQTSATQSGLRTLGSGSREPSARAAAVRIEVWEGNPLASI
jgi:hypothetical protein